VLDDQLIQDLETTYGEIIELLYQHDITTYSQLFAVLRDENADASLRLQICWALPHLSAVAGKRRVVPSLIDVLKSTNEHLQRDAAQALGSLGSRRAVFPLIELAQDKNQPEMARIFAITALQSIDDKRAIAPLTAIMFDQSDNLRVRAEAVEWTSHFADASSLPDYIALLSDSAADIRFWASFGLTQFFTDISQALSELDRLVAFDHILPKHWGWHVDREAINPLEKAYIQVWKGYSDDAKYYTWLISPVPEYGTFFRQYRKWADEDWTYYTAAQPPPVTLDVDPAWLADRLREQWPDVQLNVRQPRPQAYLLDWRMSIEGVIFSGALHRDRYAVVATSDAEAVYAFTAWYRSIIAPEQPLFLYEWADIALELRPGMTASEIEAAERLKNDERTFKG
jgi:hypothetical protein